LSCVSLAQQAAGFGFGVVEFWHVIARSCSLTAVADVLAPLLGQSYNTLRERLRDTYREAGAKPENSAPNSMSPSVGRHGCVAIGCWSVNRCHCRGCDELGIVLWYWLSVCVSRLCVPVAWKVLRAQEKHAWKPEWQVLLKTVSRSFARRLDGHRVGGSWLIREVVV